jgi:tRNA A-37 threonylcarbamoyl transferase component Bud32
MQSSMRIAPIPANEAERLEALRSCGILDSEPEPQFDEIAKLASQLCAVPMALVSLIDHNRQWFKSKVGVALAETPRDVSFCAHAVASGEPLIVPDALADERFFDNPFVVNDPSIRFYAGIPLMLEEGLHAGTLCVLDRVPRDITPGQFDALRMLARQVTTELKLRRRLATAQAQARGEVQAEGSLPSQLLTTRMPLAQESVIAERYRVERLLGAGGMGVVVAAEDLQTGEAVAIKFLLREEMKQPDGLGRFVREARALLRLASEHVVRILDVGNLANGAPYIVMEYLEGEDLRARLAAGGPGRAREVIDMMLQACAAVESAHACGIVHRDLKPANLFLVRREDGGTTLKVLDFGVSKLQEAAAREDAALTGLNMMVGSVYYMAPEQMENGRDSDARADIWSLGVILYEALAGVRPFAGETIAEVCTQVMLSPPVPLEQRRPDLPAALCEVVARCLSKDRALRFATAEALREALLAVPG